MSHHKEPTDLAKIIIPGIGSETNHKDINSDICAYLDDYDKWKLRNTCKTARKFYIVGKKTCYDIIQYSVHVGSISMFKLSLKMYCMYYKSLSIKAAHQRNIPFLRFLIVNGFQLDDDNRCVDIIAGYGEIELLKLLYMRGHNFNETTYLNPARQGNLETVKYLQSINIRWDSRVTEFSANNGHLNCLEYAHINGCPMGENVCKWAKENDHYDCLEYAVRNKFPNYRKYEEYLNVETCVKKIKVEE